MGSEVHHVDYSSFSQAQIGLSLPLLPVEFQKLSEAAPSQPREAAFLRVIPSNMLHCGCMNSRVPCHPALITSLSTRSGVLSLLLYQRCTSARRRAFSTAR